MRRAPAVFAGIALAVCAAQTAAQEVSVPPGFEISVFAGGLSGVRTLKLGPDGMLYAVLSRAGQIVRMDLDGGRRETVARGLARPYGLAFRDGWMYVGEEHQVVRFRGPGYERTEVVIPDLPEGGHWTREIAFGPDGMLYLSVGSSCNICEEADPRRAAVTRYAPDGSGERRFAEGLRNSAGLAFHPVTGALWASQNERDMLGDDLPVEEINLLTEGAHYGWPYCHGQRIPNPEYSDMPGRCARTVPPVVEIPAHTAPLGMVFYTGEQFPEEYRGDLFVALHGSWNRTEKAGYALARVDFVDGEAGAFELFATGWLTDGGRVTGRPVYPLVTPDGSIFLSDDQGGRVYRIRWVGQ